MDPVARAVEPEAAFLIIVPPGWARLPVRPDQRSALTEMIEAIVTDALPADLPRDSAEPWRAELRKRLLSEADKARDAGASALYLPARPVDGIPVPASLIETEVDDDDVAPAADVIAELLRDPQADAMRVVIDGADAVRTDTALSRVPLEDDGLELATRQVVYTIDVPHRAGRWVVLSFTTIMAVGASGELGDALVLLFDAMMTTFRWAAVEGAEPSDLEMRLAEISALVR